MYVHACVYRAASVKPRFLCVWKLIGDCCTCLHQVNAGTARYWSNYDMNLLYILCCLVCLGGWRGGMKRGDGEGG